MRSIPNRLLVAIIGVVVLATSTFVLTALSRPWELDRRSAALTILLLAMVVVAHLHPMELVPKTKTTLATAPLFASVLILSMPLAMTIAGAGALIGDATRRAPWFQGAFNTGEAILRIAAAATVFAITGATAIATRDATRWLIAAPLAAAAMYVVNSTVVEFIVAVQLRHFSLSQFLRRRRADIGPEFALCVLGLVIAVVGGFTPWGLAILLGVFAILRHQAARSSPAAVAGHGAQHSEA